MHDVCRKCGATDDLIRKPQRRPVCRPCDNAYQRESRARRLGRRRIVGESERFTCRVCGGQFDRVITPGPAKRMCDKCLRLAYNEKARNKWRATYLRRRYEISVAEYERMLAAQGGQCAICRSAKPGGKHDVFVVDHCHENGHVRGLLCDQCNRGLGMFRDSPAALLRASEYVSRPVQLRLA